MALQQWNTLVKIQKKSSTGGNKKRTTAKIGSSREIFLCQMDMIEDAQTEDGYDFSHIFSGIINL